jgi:DNA-directed RNA polymerase subunit RPC12/RpoP
MSHRFYCPCGQKLSVEEDQLGKRVRCPKCSRVLTPPQPLLNHTEINEPDDDAETKKFPSVEGP